MCACLNNHIFWYAVPFLKLISTVRCSIPQQTHSLKSVGESDCPIPSNPIQRLCAQTACTPNCYVMALWCYTHLRWRFLVAPADPGSGPSGPGPVAVRPVKIVHHLTANITPEKSCRKSFLSGKLKNFIAQSLKVLPQQ